MLPRHTKRLQSYRRGYLLALSSIALVATLGELLTQQFLANNEHDAELVNRSGLQRMHSQRLTKAALELMSPSSRLDSDHAREELEQTLRRLEASHRTLPQLAGYGPALAPLFARLEPPFLGLTTSAQALLDTPESAPARRHALLGKMLEHEAAFLPVMDELVGSYEAVATAKLHGLRITRLLLLGATLMVLLLEAFYLFEPLRRSLKIRMLALERARREAETATIAKEAFLATVSHEMRTPLHGILGMTELLRDSELDAQQRTWTRASRESATSLLTLIDGILDFAKLRCGEIALEHVPFRVREVCDNLAERSRRLIGPRRVSLVCEVAPSVPEYITGDPHRIELVLANLLENAAKFTEVGEIKLSATVLEGQLVFDVTDTGVGIPSGIREEIFACFHQAEDATTRRFGGAGMGLTVGRASAELMDGSLRLVDSSDAGSHFRFSLPLSRTSPSETEASPELELTEHAADALNEGPAGVACEAFGTLEGLSVLAADDNPVNRRLVSAFLRPLGCAVTLAEDGLEAYEHAAQRDFDAILMDCQMPRVNGFEATRRIRELPAHTDTPIIALTASVRDEDRETTLVAGMNDFLAKPHSGEQLARMLRKWCLSRPEALAS
ncbi:MAG: hypothetical protein DHS20C15_23200 [Planctomycetota bacterium]|nr:MAG: hypothetical protein DHS20C15_23200 [Planctomycetota bacterium]